MYSHVVLGAESLEESEHFYDLALRVLHPDLKKCILADRIFYIIDKGVFAITTPINGRVATHGNGSTVGFAAATPARVDAWHRVGLGAGGELCEDPPGPRETPLGQFYVGYLRDPSGNKVCALSAL